MSENYDASKPLGTFSALQTYHTYSWINNEQFYALVPHPYRDYYFRFVKKFFYWYDGFVPYFHNTTSGMFSSRLAYTILHKLAQQTVGNRLMFDDEGIPDKNSYTHHGKTYNSLEWIEHWSNDNLLDTKVVQAQEWAYAGGDSILKLDTDAKDAFVSVGSMVQKGDKVCIIEAMKVMNEIKAPTSGIIKEILVLNENLVEFDQPLMVLE